MSEISVRRKQGWSIVILSDDSNVGIEVTLDASEAAKLGALLLDHALDSKVSWLTFDSTKMRVNARPFQQRRYG
jgi:hypothetical protein